METGFHFSHVSIRFAYSARIIDKPTGVEAGGDRPVFSFDVDADE